MRSSTPGSSHPSPPNKPLHVDEGLGILPSTPLILAHGPSPVNARSVRPRRRIPWRDASRAGRLAGMSKRDKLLLQILRGTSDASIPFEGLRSLLLSLGFDERIRGGHHIFSCDRVAEILNLQPKGAQAKAYQVKQVRQLILKYKLAGEPDEA